MINLKNKQRVSLVLVLALIMVFPIFFLPATEEVRYPRVFVVEKGETIRQVGEELKKGYLVSSTNAFIISSYFFGNKVLAGSYYFERPIGTLFRAKQIAKGKRNVPIRKIVIKEQMNIHDFTDTIVYEFPNIDREEFESLAFENNGYLYPDTYFFPSDIEPNAIDLIQLMRETFDLKTKKLRGGYSEDEWGDLIKIASIIELEASKHVDRKLISGVIYNRLEKDIPLQVDVSFLFINEKNTFDLSLNDLKIDDPFNSYRNKGLPPSPISNPTLSSIEAAINPVEHEYLYFLADRYGNTYYSKTFKEHTSKKYIYLK